MGVQTSGGWIRKETLLITPSGVFSSATPHLGLCSNVLAGFGHCCHRPFPISIASREVLFLTLQWPRINTQIPSHGDRTIIVWLD